MLFVAAPGRPAFHISKEQLAMLLKARFSVPCIAELLNVSARTIERRIQEYGLSVRAFYTEIQDCQLHDIVRDIKRGNHGCGSKMLIGYLSARGIFLPRGRVRESLSRVDPLAVAARRCKAIKRRVYNVKRPLGLWHFDGNHKLVKWRFVVHGCVDGFSRLPVFLSCSTNNTAATVYSLFIKAVQELGLYHQESDVIRDLKMWMLSNICCALEEQEEARLWSVKVCIINVSNDCGGMYLKMFWQLSTSCFL